MSKELIERLQTCCPDPEKFKGEPHWPREAVVELCQEAADEIKRLEARADANADHAKLANKNQASIATSLKQATAKIGRLEGENRALKSAIKSMRFEAARFTGFVELCDDALNKGDDNA